MCPHLYVHTFVNRDSSFAFSIGRPWPLVCPLAGHRARHARTNWFHFFQFFSDIISFQWNLFVHCVHYSMCFVFEVQLESIFVNLYFDMFGICLEWPAPIQTAECVRRQSCFTPYPVSGEYNTLYQVNTISCIKKIYILYLVNTSPCILVNTISCIFK